MTLVCQSTCSPWATTADLCTPCDDYAINTGLMEDYLIVSSDLLYELSAQQFPGSCRELVNPCDQTYYSNFLGIPRRIEALATGHLCSSSCGCGPVNKIGLGFDPISRINEVKIAGEVINPDTYYIQDFHYLVRADATWPSFNEDFTVDFDWGRPPPPAGIRAAAALACELYIACDPEAFEGKCRLPPNAIQVARQGTSVILTNPATLFINAPHEPARTGVWEIDTFLRAYNPNGLASPTVVLSPDTDEPVTRIRT